MSIAASDRASTARQMRPKAQQILDAARVVFLDSGFDASSMDAIARQAAVSKATLYAHFENKEDLFAALIRFECQAIGASLYRPDPDAEAWADELEKLANNLRSIFTENDAPALYRIIVPVAVRFPRLAQIFFEEGPGAAIRDTSAYLQRLCEAGKLQIPNLEAAAEQFIFLVSGDMELRSALALSPKSTEQSRALVRASIDMFVRYYTASASSTSRAITAP
ncbi:TetR/AcrR family transcriptional regulator [Rhodopseudomonas sp. BR0M22]|uniref:TetR/AcrR family transcriptional regulator n=1 Tax=Rhodopseudomonas sp. BR0M22 TaxID=2269369 RepID=UPI0013DF606C|nr:TetR/AcrR family transcriptional regulator [Rhodopseudomonas sp. BR0M22]NEW90630.1 TetR/AcrR family transcriptional regulator [Rhodopseudomonas sp. BR0M22]